MGSVDPLAAIKIVSPCTVPWSSMAGDERVRHCSQCRKDVYNVAAMKPDEARAVIEKAEGQLCLRLARRSDGTVVTGDCRARLRAARQRGFFAFAGALVVVLAVEVWAQAFGLRALSAFLRGESKASPITQDEIDRAPTIHAPRPVRSSRLSLFDNDREFVMGGVLGTQPTTKTPPLMPPSVGKMQKQSGEDPPFPRSLRRSGQNYVVLAKVCVSQTGNVESVTPVREGNRLLDESVVSTVKMWTYRPLILGTAAIPFCTVLAFDFKSTP